MSPTLTDEDNRKTKLFQNWIDHLTEIHLKFDDDEFDEIYEGLVTVSDLSKNRIGFHLEDKRSIRHVPITPEISGHSSRLDTMYVVLGLKNGKWWPLDVISIGSIVPGGLGGAHITYNPLYNLPQSGLLH